MRAQLAEPQAPAAAPEPPPSPADLEPVVVQVENLGKRFNIYKKPLHRLWEWLRLRKNLHTEFWAVRGVSFQVRRGRCLGIIGANGSGKSTLLKMLTGAMYATEGRHEIQGRVLSLIELGTGLNPNLSGRANVIHAAALLGFAPTYAREKMDEIEAFADLGEFFDRPVMLYSSGMRVRLAFSMFAVFRPEVFMVDEALSVGDVFFQQKCAVRLRELMETGMTMIFVSHDQGAVLNLCDEAMVLSHGRPIFQGKPEEAVSRYTAALAIDGGARNRWSRKAAPPPVQPSAARARSDGKAGVSSDAEAILRHDLIGTRREHRHGTGKLTIEACRITDLAGRDATHAMMGHVLSFHLLLQAHEAIEHPRAGVRLFDRFNTVVFGAGTAQLGHELPPLAAGQRLIVRFDLKLDVEPGQYTFGLGAGEPQGDDPNAGIPHDRIELLGPITVRMDRSAMRPFYGKARLPLTASHSTIDPPPA